MLNVEVGARNNFVVRSKDRYGNSRNLGGDILLIAATGPDGQ
jgi:hypothetical protein